jgi:hypothetical protein
MHVQTSNSAGGHHIDVCNPARNQWLKLAWHHRPLFVRSFESALSSSTAVAPNCKDYSTNWYRDLDLSRNDLLGEVLDMNRLAVPSDRVQMPRGLRLLYCFAHRITFGVLKGVDELIQFSAGHSESRSRFTPPGEGVLHPA